ncbi:MAG: hypothetical protein H6980_07215 [Gammaproteobacteria bacterium]|nr:hypothetical protein [Gammaproteobacteria bacterium]
MFDDHHPALEVLFALEAAANDAGRHKRSVAGLRPVAEAAARVPTDRRNQPLRLDCPHCRTREN